MANVAAQLGQRDEDLARIRDQIAMRLVAQRRRKPHQRLQIRVLGERQRLGCRQKPPVLDARHDLVVGHPQRSPIAAAARACRSSNACARVSDGTSVKAARSSGVSTSSAMPGRRSTVGRMPIRLGRPQMREEAVLAKAQGHGVGRRADDRVRPSLVARRGDRERRRRAVRDEKLGDLGRSDERNVAGHGQHAGTPLRGEEPCRRRNRSAVPVAGACFDNAGAIAPRQPACRRVDRHDRQPAETRRRGERRQYILEHRQHQRPPPLGRQHRRQPFLRPIQFLDRHDRPHTHLKHRGRPPPALCSPRLHDPRWSTSMCAPISPEYRGLQPHSHPPRRR